MDSNTRGKAMWELPGAHEAPTGPYLVISSFIRTYVGNGLQYAREGHVGASWGPRSSHRAVSRHFELYMDICRKWTPIREGRPCGSCVGHTKLPQGLISSFRAIYGNMWEMGCNTRDKALWEQRGADAAPTGPYLVISSYIWRYVGNGVQYAR